MYCFVDLWLPFFLWPLCCLSSFYLQILIMPLVSPNCSCKQWSSLNKYVIASTISRHLYPSARILFNKMLKSSKKICFESWDDSLKIIDLIVNYSEDGGFGKKNQNLCSIYLNVSNILIHFVVFHLTMFNKSIIFTENFIEKKHVNVSTLCSLCYCHIILLSKYWILMRFISTNYY